MRVLLVAASLAILASPVLAQPAPPAEPMPMEHGKGSHGMMKADANGDGRITLDEFKAAAKARLTRLDTDHDGRISRAEFLAARPERHRHGASAMADRPPPPPPGAPDAPPPPGAQGMKGGRAMMEKMHARMAERMFSRMDMNDDGFISGDEIDKSAQRLFNFLDLNDDGVLSGKELDGPGGMGGPR